MVAANAATLRCFFCRGFPALADVARATSDWRTGGEACAGAECSGVANFGADSMAVAGGEEGGEAWVAQLRCGEEEDGR